MVYGYATNNIKEEILIKQTKKNKEVCYVYKPLPCSSCYSRIKEIGKNSM